MAVRGFEEREERLRFLISKIDLEITRFEKELKELELKESQLNKSITSKGLQTVPLKLTPHSLESSDLIAELKQHLLDLNKLKNLISQKLNLVIKEEELLESLKKEYGEAVNLKKTGRDEFELELNDIKTQEVFNELKASKKTIAALRKSLQEFAGEEKE